MVKILSGIPSLVGTAGTIIIAGVTLRELSRITGTRRRRIVRRKSKRRLK